MPRHRTSGLFMASSALIVGLVIPGLASADPVQITSGALIFNGKTSPSITATSASGDLTMNLNGFLFSGLFLPPECNFGAECAGGAAVLLTAAWNGGALPGSATFMGTDYRVGSQSMSSAQAAVRFDGALTLPVDFTGGTLTAPFRFTGSFDYPTGPNFENHTVPLFGQGTAALTFAPSVSFPGAFSLTGARYDFEPTPEPASLILIGTGLAGTWATRRGKRSLVSKEG